MTVAISGLSKAFGGAAALSDVDFKVEAGEVHALLGPNGAGKSTLIRCLSGAVAPDAGEIAIGDRVFAALTPKLAMEAGVAVIYQNMSLIPSLTVCENVFLGDELTRWGFVRRGAQRARVTSLLHNLLGSTEIDPDAILGSLPLATRQLVEVAKALNRADVKLLILDEPTAALTETEAQVIFDRLRTLRGQGTAHHLHHTSACRGVRDRRSRHRIARRQGNARRPARGEAQFCLNRYCDCGRASVTSGSARPWRRRSRAEGGRTDRSPLRADRPASRRGRSGRTVRRVGVGAH